ncbi:hypothetical protein ACROYT_G012396 [Oculina patagonica]
MKIIIYLAVFIVKVILGTPVSFNGEGFISFDLKTIPTNTRQSILQLRFRTIHPNGLLAYSKGTKGHFLRLEIIKGRLHYSSYLGGSHQGGISTITSPSKDLNDDKWHNVTLTREGRKSVLSVDEIATSNIFQGDYKDLDLVNVLFIGGMKAESDQLFRVKATKHFRGCLEDVKYDSTDILLGAMMGLNGIATRGEISFKCRSRPNRIISSTKPNLSVRIPHRRLSTANFFTTSFQFRTHIKDGLLISFIAPKLKCYLLLSNSALVFEVTAVSGSKTELRLGSNLDDSEWHRLILSLAGSEIRFGLDGQVTTKHVNYTRLIMGSTSKLRPKIFLGKESRRETVALGFVGCILDLKVQDREILFRDLKSRNSQNTILRSCHLQNRCDPNPCKNRGQCSQDWKQFYCNCDYTEFEGKLCEISVYKPTCEDYRSMGLRASTFCLLDSEGIGNPYTALCNVTNPSRTYTVVTHNKMTETPVGRANLDFSGLFYKHEVSYTGPTGMNQIKALTQKSKHCRQYIRFHCFGSKLLNTPRGPSHAFWLSRDGNRQEYWGGAEPGSKKCACGMADPPSCAGRAKFCNCDVRDENWRVDEGYLRDKSTLPVTALLFSKKSKRSDFTLGPLECWGNEGEESTESMEEKLKANPVDYRLMKACPTGPKLQTTVNGIYRVSQQPQSRSQRHQKKRLVTLEVQQFKNAKTSPQALERKQ